MTTKLYPPYIEGTLPAFYITKDTSNNVLSASITIPFEMNASVNSVLISGFSLMLKTTSSGTYIFSSLRSNSFDLDKNTVTFIVDANEAKVLNEGQFYKAQIAYIDLTGNVGYYSTVGIIKCVSLPTISIVNLEADSTNFFNNEFIGLYDQSECNDQTEKVYSYEFIIYNELNEQVYTTGEQLHKQYYDSDYDASIDKVSINNIIPKDKVYNIQYKVTTQNKLYLSSPKYKITNSNLMPFNQYIDIIPEADEDTGVITINFKGEQDLSKAMYWLLNKSVINNNNINIADVSFFLKNIIRDNPKYQSQRVIVQYSIYNDIYGYSLQKTGQEEIVKISDILTFISEENYNAMSEEDKNQYIEIYKVPFEKIYYGSYLLSRADDSDNYTTWVSISRFKLEGQRPSVCQIEDITIEHGRKYLYALQQYNAWGLYSQRIESKSIITANFEDAFLYDGDKILKIRYNVDVNSFKTTILEQKSNTIGGKFPYITRNGETYYREFPLGGLLAQELDINNCFTNVTQVELHRHSTGSIDDVDTSLNTSRYSYSDENIALEREFKLNVLDWLNNGKPKLFKSPYEGNYIVQLMNISLQPVKELGRFLHSFTSTAFEIAEYNYQNLIDYGFIKAYAPSDFVGMWKTYNFSDYPFGSDIDLLFDSGLISFTVQDMKPGTIIKIRLEGQSDWMDIMIGSTGSYTYLGTGKPVVELFISQEQEKIYGILNCYYQSNRITAFDSIVGMSLKTIPDQQFIGIDPNLKKFKSEVIDSIESNNGITTNDYSKTIDLSNWNTLYDYNLRDQLQDYYTMVRDTNGKISYYLRNTGVLQDFKNFIRNYKVGDLLNKINITIGNGLAYKRKLIDIEQAKFILRPIIPVYCLQGNPTNHKEDLQVAISPYGYPHPIEHLNHIEPVDIYAIYQIFYIDNGKWVSHNGADQYYDPYYKTLLPQIDDNDSVYSSMVTIITEDAPNTPITFDLATIKEKTLKHLKNIISLEIGAGVIAHVTYQVQEIEYYTEASDIDVIQAKQDYINAKNLFQSLLTAYPIIAKASYETQRNYALSLVYDKLLNGDTNFNQINDKINSTINLLLDNEIEKEELKLLSFYKVKYININLDQSLIDQLLIYKDEHSNEKHYGFDDLKIYYYEGSDNEFIYFFLQDLNKYIIGIEKIIEENKEPCVYYQEDQFGVKYFFAVDKTEVQNELLPIYMAQTNNVVWETQGNILNAGYTIYPLIYENNNELKIYVNNQLQSYSYYQEIEEFYDNDTIQNITDNVLYISIDGDAPLTYNNEESIYDRIYFEEDHIKYIISKNESDDYNQNIPTGINDKILIANKQLDLFKVDLEEMKQNMSEAAKNYIALYNQLQNTIQKYNTQVYQNWALTKLADLLTIVETIVDTGESQKLIYNGYFRKIIPDQDILTDDTIRYKKNLDNSYEVIASEELDQIEDQYIPLPLIDIYSIFASEKERALREKLILEDVDDYYNAAVNLINNSNYKTQLTLAMTSASMTGDRSDDPELDLRLNEQASNAYGYLTLCLCALYKDYSHTQNEQQKKIIKNYYQILYNLLVDSNGNYNNEDNLKYYISRLYTDYEQRWANERINIATFELGGQGFLNYNNVSQLSISHDDLKELFNFIANGLTSNDLPRVNSINNFSFMNNNTVITINNITLKDPLDDEDIQQDLKKYTLQNAVSFNNQKETNIYKHRRKFQPTELPKDNVLNPCIELIFNPFQNDEQIYQTLSSNTQLVIVSIYEQIADIIVNTLATNTEEKNRDTILSNIISRIKNSSANTNPLSTDYLIEYKRQLSEPIETATQLVLSNELRIITRLQNMLIAALGKLDVYLNQLENEDDKGKIKYIYNGEDKSLSIKNELNQWQTFSIYSEDTQQFFSLSDNEQISYTLFDSYTINENETKIKNYKQYYLPSLIILNDEELTYITKPIESNENGLDYQGIYYEYLKYEYQNKINEIDLLLNQTQNLYSLYQILLKNYGDKYDKYLKLYNNYQTIYLNYQGSKELEFYNSNLTLDEQLLIVKQAWWAFLNILDYKYTLERERGLYA